MEEFRSIIVDSMALACLNKRILQQEDFDVGLGDVHTLKPEARKKFLLQYEERKATEIKHPLFEYRATYQRCFELQARLLAKYLQREVEAYEPFSIR